LLLLLGQCKRQAIHRLPQLIFLMKEGAKKIRFLCLLAAPKDVVRIKATHPDVPIITASLDACLNEKGYIFLGLGDASDRIFGAK
jgi:uracil phosphoribosyltransferase